MNPHTGEIYYGTSEFTEALGKELGVKLVPLSKADGRALTHMNCGERKNWMRNRPCICGSGKKFKRCCWSSFL